jgi:hypothetical protein
MDGRTPEQAAAAAAATGCGWWRMGKRINGNPRINNLGRWYIYAMQIGPGLGAIFGRALGSAKIITPANESVWPNRPV